MPAARSPAARSTAGPLGTGLVTLSGGTLQDDGAGRTLANAVSISGDVTLGSAGAGGLTLGPQGLTVAKTVTIVGAPTIYVTAPTTIADQISGGTLIKAGSSLLTLTGSNTYTGPTTISGGTLQLGSGAAGGPGSINSTSGVVDNGFLAFDSSATITTFAHNISGSGGVEQLSAGKALRLTGNNSYAGPTLIGAGTLQSGSAAGYGALPSTTSLEIASGGVYWLVGNQTVASLADLGSSGGKVMCSNGSTATLTLAPPAGTTTFSGVVQNYNATSGTLALVLAGVGTQRPQRQQYLQRQHDHQQRHAAIGKRWHHRFDRRHHDRCRQRRPGLRPFKQPLLRARYQRQRQFESNRPRRPDPQRQRQLQRRHHGGRRHPPVQREQCRSWQREHHHPERRRLGLGSDGIYSTVTGWLTSGKIAVASPGAVALIADDSEPISMGSYASLSLGASGAATYSGVFTPSGSTYNLGGGGGTLTFTPAMTGAASLNVNGPGAVVLSGSNTYSGGTTVASGTLDFSTTESMSTSGVLTIQSGGEVVLGDLVGAESPSTAESEPAVADAAVDNSSPIIVSGTVSDGGIDALLARIRAAQAAHDTAAGSLDGVAADASPAAVPEPSTFILLGVGVLGLLGYVWRRKRAGI